MNETFKVVCVFDSFKGSLDSLAAGEAAKRGVLETAPDAEVSVFPIADGGEGTMEALMWAAGKERFSLEMLAADHRAPITANYGTLDRDGHTIAVLESAQTIGIDQVQVDESLPPQASSYGFGLMLDEALTRGADEILVTLGGSATTDGGTGLFQALGATFYDAEGNEIPTDTNPLWHFDHADFSGVRSVGGVQVTILNDVTNPMCGPAGAAATFGPQKGATSEQVDHLDAQQEKWATALEEAWSVNIADVPGAGAAGGLGGAFLALGGEMQPGFIRIAQELAVPEAIENADLVLTGEGSLDWQSAYGKVPAGVGKLAQESGAVVVGLAGRVGYPLGELTELLDGVFSIHCRPRSLEDALDREVTEQAIQNTASQVVQLVRQTTTKLS